jgi:flagellar hook-associated protein 3 FlgL
MATRVADINVFQSAVLATQTSRARLALLQEQVATGRRLSSIGDDPQSAARIVGLDTTLDRLGQLERNIELARTQADATEAAIGQLTDVLIRVRELAVSAQDLASPRFPQIQAEVEQRFSEALAIANTQVGGRYVFAGFATDTAPVTQTGPLSGPVSAVAYNGDSGAIQTQVDESSRVQINVTARELFFGSTDGDDTAEAPFVNIFDTIQDLVNRLRDPATNGRPTDTLGAIDQAIEQTTQIQGRLGATSSRLDTTRTQLGAIRVAAERERSFLRDVDIVEAITQLQSQESQLQAALGITARILQPSLLDFLR